VGRRGRLALAALVLLGQAPELRLDRRGVAAVLEPLALGAKDAASCVKRSVAAGRPCSTSGSPFEEMGCGTSPVERFGETMASAGLSVRALVTTYEATRKNFSVNRLLSLS